MEIDFKKLMFNVSLLWKPDSWLIIGEYDKDVDMNISKILDDPVVEEYTDYEITINSQTFSCEHLGYYCGMTTMEEYSSRKIPSRYNMYRFKKLVTEYRKALKNEKLEKVTHDYFDKFCRRHFKSDYNEVLNIVKNYKPEDFI